MNLWLVLAGTASALVGALHLAIIVGGANWYRFFGAGEAMARQVARGSPFPTIETLVLAFIFFAWALYAFSGAGLIRPLPWLIPILTLIAAVYLFRGALLVPTLFGLTPLNALPTIKPNDAFTVWSSSISFAIGALYAIGAWRYAHP